jgi:hypothetical protein
MTPLLSLWLPVLLSAVVVFVVSSVIHMVLPWHRREYPKLPDEEAFRQAVGPLGIPPGEYIVPRTTSMAEMKSPEFTAKLEQGPVMILTVLPNRAMSMGKSLGLWFVYQFVVTVFAAYVAGRALPAGAEYLAVFRFAGATAFIGYALALWQMTIWYNRSLYVTLTATFDGFVYALCTAGVFGWLWPQ